MDKLKARDEFGVMAYKGHAEVGSRDVAEIFQKSHQHVMESIRKILDSQSGISPEFGRSNFRQSSYKNAQGKSQPEYMMTRDGFALLGMGFTGKRAMKFKEDYIHRFNQMESFIRDLAAARLEFPEFTDAILAAHEAPAPYHFSNEIDMINRIVLGMSAKEYKKANGIPDDAPSIRPFLDAQQIKAIERLQRFDTGLLVTEPSYVTRKHILTQYHLRVMQIKGLPA